MGSLIAAVAEGFKVRKRRRGRPPIGGKALTGKERMRRHRAARRAAAAGLGPLSDIDLWMAAMVVTDRDIEAMMKAGDVFVTAEQLEQEQAELTRRFGPPEF